MGKLYHGDKVSPHEAKPSLLPLETEKFLIAREPSGNLIFAELCRRVRAPLALPTSLSTFCLRRVSVIGFPGVSVPIDPGIAARCMI